MRVTGIVLLCGSVLMLAITGTAVSVSDPCNPSPCGQLSQCKVAGGDRGPLCSCLPGTKGLPPNCTPGCVMNADCEETKACINLKCTDPCPGACGPGATCEVIKYNPVCSCPPLTTGDPFIICRKLPVPVEESPCTPSPCGPNAQCHVINKLPVCSCPYGYTEKTPTCRPECSTNSDCAKNKVCVDHRCQDRCSGRCGFSAVCVTDEHNSSCSCPEGFTGDPHDRCGPLVNPALKDPCETLPCGPNSRCQRSDGRVECSCLPDHRGEPPFCRPECQVHTDCEENKGCINSRCRDPCPGVCGHGATCKVVKHNPICNCPPLTTGDAFRECKNITAEQLCATSPCGNHSHCDHSTGRVECSCVPPYIGSPPDCRPECEASDDCAHHRACVNQTCVDPCQGQCGKGASCHVLNHESVCFCPPLTTGDPSVECKETPARPCDPSPCGSFSLCEEKEGRPVCTCVPGNVGNPPSCRPECTINSECAWNHSCISNKCTDPCFPGQCGDGAFCKVVRHIATCACPPLMQGDPFVGCKHS